MKRKKVITVIIIFISILLIVTGIVFGNLKTGILDKAVNICLECIGIG